MTWNALHTAFPAPEETDRPGTRKSRLLKTHPDETLLRLARTERARHCRATTPPTGVARQGGKPPRARAPLSTARRPREMMWVQEAQRAGPGCASRVRSRIASRPGRARVYGYAPAHLFAERRQQCGRQAGLVPHGHAPHPLPSLMACRRAERRLGPAWQTHGPFRTGPRTRGRRDAGKTGGGPTEGLLEANLSIAFSNFATFQLSNFPAQRWIVGGRRCRTSGHRMAAWAWVNATDKFGILEQQHRATPALEHRTGENSPQRFTQTFARRRSEASVRARAGTALGSIRASISAAVAPPLSLAGGVEPHSRPQGRWLPSRDPPVGPASGASQAAGAAPCIRRSSTRFMMAFDVSRVPVPCLSTAGWFTPRRAVAVSKPAAARAPATPPHFSLSTRPWCGMPITGAPHARAHDLAHRRARPRR